MNSRALAKQDAEWGIRNAERAKGRAFAKLSAEWSAKLAASGFEDLEGRDRDRPLSNRGKLHDGKGKEAGQKSVEVEREDGDFQHFRARIEHGAEYTEWAQGVLQRLTGQGATARRNRRVWQLHAEGMGLRDIAAEMGTTFHAARATVMRIESRYRCQDEMRVTDRDVELLTTRALLATAAALVLVVASRSILAT